MNVKKSILIALAEQEKDRKWLAKATQSSEAQVSRWINAQAVTSMSLERLARAFGMSVSEFIALGEKPPRSAHSASGDVS